MCLENPARLLYNIEYKKGNSDVLVLVVFMMICLTNAVLE